MKTNHLFLLLGITSLILSCSKENNNKLEVTPDSIILYSEGTAQLSTNVDDAIFTSVDDFYAKVDESGLVTANKIGETVIKVSSSNGSVNVPVKVLNQYSLYPDVDGLIGKGISDMTNLLGNGYETSTSSSGSIVYAYRNPTRYAAVIAVSMKSGKCESVAVLVSTSYISKLANHIIERYARAGMQNDAYFFLNHDKNVLIGVELYNVSYQIALYVPYTSSSKSAEIQFDITDFDTSAHNFQIDK